MTNQKNNYSSEGEFEAELALLCELVSKHNKNFHWKRYLGNKEFLFSDAIREDYSFDYKHFIVVLLDDNKLKIVKNYVISPSLHGEQIYNVELNTIEIFEQHITFWTRSSWTHAGRN